MEIEKKIEEYDASKSKDWLEIVRKKSDGNELNIEDLEILQTIPTKMAEIVNIPQNGLLIKQRMQEAARQRKKIIFLPFDSSLLRLINEQEICEILKKDLPNFEIYARKIVGLCENDTRLHVHLNFGNPMQPAYTVQLCWCCANTTK